MDAAPYFAYRGDATPVRVLAALGPKMLELAATRAVGAHPYFVPVEHTAVAREHLGPDALLLPEQKVVLETDPTTARAIGRRAMAIYLALPNYTNNLRRFGYGDDDFADGGSDRLVDAIVAWGDEDAIKARVRRPIATPAPTTWRPGGAGRPVTGAVPMAEWRRLAPRPDRLTHEPTRQISAFCALLRARSAGSGVGGVEDRLGWSRRAWRRTRRRSAAPTDPR